MKASARSLILLLVVLLAACSAAPSASPATPVQSEAPTPADTPTVIAMGSYTAVIFPGTGDPDVIPGPISGYWTPSEADILRLDRGLVTYLQSAAPEGAPDLVAQLAGATGQFFGIVSSGRRLIYGSFFCEEGGVEHLERLPAYVTTGGACFFQVRYDVAADEFIELRINPCSASLYC